MRSCISAEQTSDGNRPGWTCGFWTPEVGKAHQKPGEGSSAPIPASWESPRMQMSPCSLCLILVRNMELKCLTSTEPSLPAAGRSGERNTNTLSGVKSGSTRSSEMCAVIFLWFCVKHWRVMGVEVHGTPELHNFYIGSCRKNLDVIFPWLGGTAASSSLDIKLHLLKTLEIFQTLSYISKHDSDALGNPKWGTTCETICYLWKY